MKKTFASLLLLTAALAPTLAQAEPVKIPTTTCELAAFLGIVNVKSCEEPTE